MTDTDITEAQRRLHPLPLTPRTRTDYRRVARWWELEARRGHESAPASLQYARNMRWAAELTESHGHGTWSELLSHSGLKSPSS